MIFITFAKAREEEAIYSKWLSPMPGLFIFIYDFMYSFSAGVPTFLNPVLVWLLTSF